MIPSALLKPDVRVRLTIIDPNGKRRSPGRLWMTIVDQTVTVRARREQVASGTIESVTEVVSLKQWDFGMAGGDVWRVQLGCGCGG